MTVVAIDGPAGAGKSTVARAVADELGLEYLDTGALYRAAALAVLEAGVELKDEPEVERAVRSARIDTNRDRVWLHGTDVTERIRDRDVTRAVSEISAYRVVRAALLEQQQEAVLRGDVVMEGRDIGAVVAPDADVKIFLIADLEERARRRAAQLDERTDAASLRALSEALAARDRADATREASPLQRPPDAHVIDSSHKTVDEVVAEVAALVRKVAAGG